MKMNTRKLENEYRTIKLSRYKGTKRISSYFALVLVFLD